MKLIIICVGFPDVLHGLSALVRGIVQPLPEKAGSIGLNGKPSVIKDTLQKCIEAFNA